MNSNFITISLITHLLAISSASYCSSNLDCIQNSFFKVCCSNRCHMSCSSTQQNTQCQQNSDCEGSFEGEVCCDNICKPISCDYVEVNPFVSCSRDEHCKYNHRNKVCCVNACQEECSSTEVKDCHSNSDCQFNQENTFCCKQQCVDQWECLPTLSQEGNIYSYEDGGTLYNNGTAREDDELDTIDAINDIVLRKVNKKIIILAVCGGVVAALAVATVLSIKKYFSSKSQRGSENRNVDFDRCGHASQAPGDLSRQIQSQTGLENTKNRLFQVDSLETYKDHKNFKNSYLERDEFIENEKDEEAKCDYKKNI